MPVVVDVSTEDAIETEVGASEEEEEEEEGTPHISNRYPIGNITQENESKRNLLVVEN